MTKKTTKKPVKTVEKKPKENPSFFTKLKLLLTGGLCGMILGILPMLALMITPGELTKNYISGTILSSDTVEWLQGGDHHQCR